MTKTLTKESLSHFTGTENWYRHPLLRLFRSIMYTDGVKHVADAGDAYWLIDIVVSRQIDPKVRQEEFQVWTLTVVNNKGLIVAEDGNGNEIARQKIPFTDFPLDTITLWVENDVILLPSEY